MTTSVVHVGRKEAPHAIAGQVFVKRWLVLVANWNDLLDAHSAKHVQDLVTYADRVQKVAGLHGGSPEAGL